jgi:hypothetical protein
VEIREWAVEMEVKIAQGQNQNSEKGNNEDLRFIRSVERTAVPDKRLRMLEKVYLNIALKPAINLMQISPVQSS